METSLDQKNYRASSLTLWSQRILDCKNSGLTVSDWCKNNGVHEKSYWRWHKILKDQYQEYCNNNSNTTDEPEFYELESSSNIVAVAREPIVSVKVKDISIDIFTGDKDVISSIFRGLMSC